MCTLPALASLLAATQESALAPEGRPATEVAGHAGFPALFSWGDADGDGRLELAAVGLGGQLQLLTGAGDGRFEDVTERLGLGAIEDATLATWADYDGDGRLDLFVGAREGASRLFHNEGGVFSEQGAERGLVCTGRVRSAQWLDHDRDGRLDLFVVASEDEELSSRLFRGLAGGYFERAELPLSDRISAPGLGFREIEPNGEDTPAAVPPASDSPGAKGRPSARPRAESSASVRPTGGTTTGAPTAAQGLGATTGCAQALADQAKSGACMQGSSTPALGKLYPLSPNLFVALSGSVGIGTTNPTAKLHVAGTARVTDKLTLAPSGDTALDVSTGSIYKAGALFLHTRGGAGNTALGSQALGGVTSGFQNTAGGERALFTNTSGDRNTASGAQALFSNTNGDGNTANGAFALFANTTGGFNTASGYGALYANTRGSSNTAIGDSALIYNTEGAGNTASGAGVLAHNTIGQYNTASGFLALFSNTTGSFNTASGYGALYANTDGSGNTALGDSALVSNTTGNDNTASGGAALLSNTSGRNNLASGAHALHFNTTGSGNTACGRRALYSNTSGSNNTACGNAALFYNTTGGYNIAIGAAAGIYQTTGSSNITIGNHGLPGDTATMRIGATQTRTFIAGIRGAATGIANAIPILIDSAGQLGTTFSSRRFKQDIRDMGDATEHLLDLRPVLFRYKQEQTLPNGQELPPEYGLIAEEVAELFPDLVVYDDDGQPLTVKYHLLGAMLLNELKKTRAEHEHTIAELSARIAALEAR